MRKLTGSQRKTKKKQRAMRPNNRSRRAHIKLYHGTTPSKAHEARVGGLTTKQYSPYERVLGTPRVYNTVTTAKNNANTYALQKSKIVKKPSLRRSAKGKLDFDKVMYAPSHNKYFKYKVAKHSVLTIRLPKKKAHEYLVKGNTYGSYNNFGIRKPIPSKYIK